MRLILASILSLLLLASAAEAADVPQQVVLFKNAWNPAISSDYSTDWKSTSSAYTATTYWLNWRTNPTLSKAVMQLVMLAPTGGGYEATGLAVCGVGLTDVTFSNCKLLAFGSWNSSGPATTAAWVWNPATSAYDAVPYNSSVPTFGCHSNGTDTAPDPHPCWLDVTAALQPYLNYSTPVYLTVATAGNTTSRPYVYELSINFAWQTP